MTTILLAVALAVPLEPAAAKRPARPQPPAAAPAPSPEQVAQPQPPAPAPPPAAPTGISGGADARRLCEALVPTDRLRFGGSAIERGDAEARHAADRERALSSRYALTVPSDRIRFAPYSAEEGTLALYRHALPATADGAVRLNAVEEPGLPVAVDPATAKRILAAHQAKKLALQVTFVVPEDEESPCFHVSGGSTWTVAAEPVAWEYVADGAVVARGGEGSDRPMVSAREGAQPRVRVGKPLDDADGRDLRVAVLDRLEDIEGCYETALDRDPWVDGAIVADLQLAGGGPPEGVRIAADSVQDDELITCVRDVLATLDLRRAEGRAFLPIHFVLDPPRAGGAAGE